MQLKVNIDTKALLAALHKAPEAIAREVRPDMIDLSAEVQVQAAHNHRFKSKGGFLEASIKPTAQASGLGFSVQAGGVMAPYGVYVHEGTKPHTISAKNKSTLYSKSANKFFGKSVNHPGTQPDQFLFKALDAKAQQIMQVVEMSIGQALRKLGFTR